MTSNPNKDESKCWKYLNSAVNRLVRNNVTMEYDELVHQCIINYPVRVKQVDIHFKRFFLDRGIMVFNEETGRLIPPNYEQIRQDEAKKKQLELEADEEIKRLGLEVVQ